MFQKFGYFGLCQSETGPVEFYTHTNKFAFISKNYTQSAVKRAPIRNNDNNKKETEHQIRTAQPDTHHTEWNINDNKATNFSFCRTMPKIMCPQTNNKVVIILSIYNFFFRLLYSFRFVACSATATTVFAVMRFYDCFCVFNARSLSVSLSHLSRIIKENSVKVYI